MTRKADESPERYHEPEAWPFHFELIDVDSMFVDRRYQRPLTRSTVKEIMQDFDRALLEPLLVSDRGDGRYAIADGQNRWHGCKQIGERWLWCRVMKLQPQEEARIFSKLQLQRKNINPLQRYHAELFGGVPEAVQVARILKAKGINTDERKRGSYAAEDTLQAITIVRSIYEREGEAHLSRVLEIIKASFPGQAERLQTDVINGIHTYLQRNADVNDRRLIVALGDEIGTVVELKKRVQAAKGMTGRGAGGGSPVYVVRVIEAAYRKVGRHPFKAAWDLA